MARKSLVETVLQVLAVRLGALGHAVCRYFRDTLNADLAPHEDQKRQNLEAAWLKIEASRKRSHIVLFMIVLGLCICFLRLCYIQLIDSDFLQRQGENRFARTLDIRASRGEIFDRNGTVLASSLPAKTIWAYTEHCQPDEQQLKSLAQYLNVPVENLRHRLSRKKAFITLASQVPMDKVKAIEALKIKGLTFTVDYKRYYPGGEVMAHIIGFNNRQDQGQEGIELANDEVLSGKNGQRRVIRDRRGNVIEEIWAKKPEPGQDVYLSIDSRIQYAAHTSLYRAIERHQAKAGAIVVADTVTGEILALVSAPGFDPNNRSAFDFEKIRNRVLTDSFEPGSIMKPFAIAKALDLGLVKPDTLIQTAPGYVRMFDRTIHDTHNYGLITVSQVIAKSSNVGTVKIAMNMDSQTLWETYNQLGFGQAPRVGFPGATAGRLRSVKYWGPVEQATNSYGYGLSASLMQLAQAYTVFARNGDVIPLTFLKSDRPAQGEQIFKPDVARQMRAMMMTTVKRGGTASRLRVSGYTLAGKTGTVHKVKNGRYAQKDYVASFVGVAPATQPRIVVAVMIDEPTTAGHSGASAAAPVFGEVAEAALQVLLVNPDDPMMLAGRTNQAKGTK